MELSDESAGDTLTCIAPEGDGFRDMYVVRDGLRSAPIGVRYARPIVSRSSCRDSNGSNNDYCRPGDVLVMEVGAGPQCTRMPALERRQSSVSPRRHGQCDRK